MESFFKQAARQRLCLSVFPSLLYGFPKHLFYNKTSSAQNAKFSVIDSVENVKNSWENYGIVHIYQRNLLRKISFFV